MKKIPFDEISQYSGWPSRLLGLTPWEQKVKSKKEIDREYEDEKWGRMLDWIKSGNREKTLTIEEANLYGYPPDLTIPISMGKEYYVGDLPETYEAFLDSIGAGLQRFLPAVSLVELGCGFGAVILQLCKRKIFSSLPLLGAEYTRSGQIITELCARNQNTKISVGHCDFTKPDLCSLKIPPGSVIYTCFAASVLPDLPDTFIKALSAYRPLAVVHFEPFFEHQQGNNLIDLLRRKYILVNGYNQNLLTKLKDAEKDGSIEILAEKPSIFGTNPFFPHSLVAWRPR